MTRLLITTFSLLVCATTSVMAQDSDNDSKKREEMMKKMTTEQAERLAAELDLDETKTKTFTELYVEYREKEMELRMSAMPKNNKAKGDKKESKKAQKMTDAQADSLITANFEQTQKELELKKTYYEKFREHFTASQLVGVFVMQPRMGRNGMRPGNNRQEGNFGGPGEGGFGGPGGGNGFGGAGMGGNF